jgi:hypothetical protein
MDKRPRKGVLKPLVIGLDTLQLGGGGFIINGFVKNPTMDDKS